MVLKATKPDVAEKRLKMFVFGKAGCGKTTAAIQFKNAYIFDAEKGTENYGEEIIKQGSVVLKTSDFDTIYNEIRDLMTSKHEYRTIVIDPVTQVFASLKDKWVKKFDKYADSQKAKDMQNYGVGYWGKVKGEWKSFWRLLLQVDMNVIVTAHQKPEYAEGGQMVKVGDTYDSDRSDEYHFDYLFQILKKGAKRDAPRVAITLKQRTSIEKEGFPDEFEWSYANFEKLYGKTVIERASNPITLASEEKIGLLNKLIELLNISADTQDRWKAKENVDQFEEMKAERVDALIAELEKRLNAIQTNLKNGGTK